MKAACIVDEAVYDENKRSQAERKRYDIGEQNFPTALFAEEVLIAPEVLFSEQSDRKSVV